MKSIRYIFLVLVLALGVSANAQRVISSWKITDLQNYIGHSDSVLVINFWATFCKSCVAEIPYYQTITDKYKEHKVKLMLVSLDMKESFPHEISSFAANHHFYKQIVWLNETDADYFCPKIDKNWSGALPTTFFVNRKTGYRKLVERELSEKEFEAELVKAMENP